MKPAAARRARIVVYIILLLAGFLLLDMFVAIPIPFVSEIALIVACLLLAYFAFSGGYWKMFMWFLNLVMIDMPKQKAKKAFVSTLILTTIPIVALLLITNYTSGRNIPGQTVQAEVAEKTRIKSDDPEYQDSCHITFKLSNGSTSGFTFSWQSDKNFHSNIHEGDMGKLTIKKQNGQARLISFEKDADYGGAKLYIKLRDKINEMVFWQYAIFNVVLFIIFIVILYPVVCFLIFGFISIKKRTKHAEKRLAIIVGKRKYERGDRQTVYCVTFECVDGTPHKVEFEFYCKKIYHALHENESGLLSYRTTTEVWGDAEHEFIGFEAIDRQAFERPLTRTDYTS